MATHDADTPASVSDFMDWCREPQLVAEDWACWGVPSLPVCQISHITITNRKRGVESPLQLTSVPWGHELQLHTEWAVAGELCELYRRQKRPSPPPPLTAIEAISIYLSTPLGVARAKLTPEILPKFVGAKAQTLTAQLLHPQSNLPGGDNLDLLVDVRLDKITRDAAATPSPSPSGSSRRPSRSPALPRPAVSTTPLGPVIALLAKIPIVLQILIVLVISWVTVVYREYGARTAFGTSIGAALVLALASAELLGRSKEKAYKFYGQFGWSLAKRADEGRLLTQTDVDYIVTLVGPRLQARPWGRLCHAGQAMAPQAAAAAPLPGAGAGEEPEPGSRPVPAQVPALVSDPEPAWLTDDVKARFLAAAGAAGQPGGSAAAEPAEAAAARGAARQAYAWRQAVGADELACCLPRDAVEVQALLPLQPLATTRDGAAVVVRYEAAGLVSMFHEASQRHISAKRALTLQHTFALEYLFSSVVPQPLPGGQVVLVLDLEGLQMRDVLGPELPLLGRVFQQLGNAYPSRLRRVVLVNPPVWLPLLLGVLQPYVPAPVRAKVHVAASLAAAAAELAVHLPAELVPAAYGGPCTLDFSAYPEVKRFAQRIVAAREGEGRGDGSAPQAEQ